MGESPGWRHPLLSRAAQSPARLALETRAETLSFAGLAERALHTAACLARAGVEPGDRLATLLPNGFPFVCAVHASSLLGAWLVPLGTRLTVGELRPQLLRARARLLVHGGGELASRARALAGEVPGLDLAEARDGPCPVCGGAATRTGLEAPRRAEGGPGDVSAILFTSGTTGAPKGVCLTRRNLVWSALASALHLGYGLGDRWLACLPLHHVGGLAILWRSVLEGSAVRIHERFDPARVVSEFETGTVTHGSLVPTMLSRLLEVARDGPGPRGLRGLLLGGAAAPSDLVREAWNRGFPVLPTYGLTEAASQVATFPVDLLGAAAPSSPGCVGRPLFGTELRIADPRGRPLAPGREGEILVRGPTVMAGYLDDPVSTAEALRGGWLRTGDLGIVNRAGSLRVLDRRDDQFTSGGENVRPGEVEAVLLGHPDVTDVGVTGVPDPDLGRRVTAWVVAERGAQLHPGALRALCRQHLAGFKVPREIRFVAALPRTASGKLLRRRLIELEAEPGGDPAHSEGEGG